MDAVYLSAEESTYAQFYDPWAMDDRLSPVQMKLATAAPGLVSSPVVATTFPSSVIFPITPPSIHPPNQPTNSSVTNKTARSSEAHHFLDLLTYPPRERRIVAPKPYRYSLPPGLLERIILNWERGGAQCIEEVEVERAPEEVPVLAPVRLSRFTEHLEEEEGGEYGDGDGDVEDDDEVVVEEVKGASYIEVDELVDRAVRIVGKVELRIGRAKGRCVSFGKRMRRKWKVLGY